MIAARGKGWLPDDESTIDGELVSKHLSSLVGAMSPVVVETLNYTALLDKIPDQGPTSSCVGQALATCCYLTARIAGTPIPRPSAKLFYDFARAEDQPYVHMRDDGSRPLAAIRCGSDKGMVAETDWPILMHPDGMTNINARPPLDVFQNALGFKIGDYYRIAKGSGASALVRHALARGYCPMFAMPVDEAYEQLSGEHLYEGRVGPSLGGHMQAIAGYSDGYLFIVSSWGRGHGDSGIVMIANDYFDSGECTDIIVPTMIPALVAAA